MATELNISDYYQVVSVRENVVHVELKGFWSDSLIGKIGPEFIRIHENAIRSLGGKPFIILADWSACPVLGKGAIHYLTQAMMIVKRYHGHKVVEVIPSAIARMGVKAAAADTGQDDFRIVVKSLEEAHKVVEQLKQELPAQPS